jgi:hypothetical protein
MPGDNCSGLPPRPDRPFRNRHSSIGNIFEASVGIALLTVHVSEQLLTEAKSISMFGFSIPSLGWHRQTLLGPASQHFME